MIIIFIIFMIIIIYFALKYHKDTTIFLTNSPFILNIFPIFAEIFKR